MDLQLKVENVNPKARKWEQFYRTRNQYDKVVRSTHGVNCTGSCSWEVYVKNGIIVWEMQATDYPKLNSSIPPYEPRGCARGISASWYVYSPLRIKYPLIRGVLLDYWTEARKKYSNPLEAYESIMNNPEKRINIQKVRGKGGFRRIHWKDALELISSASLYTALKYGPDRVIGFSPIPAMSYISYAAGARFLQLFGGVAMSFYDWYSDLPPAFPEIWGEQTDVAESADWFNARYIVAMGSNISVTRAPDSHFIHEARHEGTKFVVVTPEFSPIAKNADWWIPVKPGQDNAMWMAINHVILSEFYVEKKVPFFTNYIKRFTDCPFVIELVKEGEKYTFGKFVRSNNLEKYKQLENGDWNLLMYDSITKEFKAPKGTIGFRWAKAKGNWNLKLEDALDNSVINPELSFIDNFDEKVTVSINNFENNSILEREIPIKWLSTGSKRIPVVTVFDILMTQFGVNRGLKGDYPSSYDDEIPYTPAWQEKLSGIGKETIIRLAREFAYNAEITEGKSMIIIGTGINHWYHNNLSYRSAILSLLLTGCVGRNGGGFNHYVGQEKAALVAPWATIAFASDWIRPPRLQQTPIWHTMNTDQWRYEDTFDDYLQSAKETKYTKGHIADQIASAVRMGWMPFYPQFNKNTFELIKEAQENGLTTDDQIKQFIIKKLQDKELKFAVQDVDSEENWPRIWFIWRANALSSSAKGQEYFLRHYLGTDDNSIAKERAKDKVKTITFKEPVPRGKMDLVVDINFRMDTSALYSDIILPTAMWYEKNDLNTTDLHTYIHPLGEAVAPAWEAKSDWNIFKALAKSVSEIATKLDIKPQKDVVSPPLLHDTPAEIAQTEVKDWYFGECNPIPGKTMPGLAFVTRDYKNLYNKYISLGRLTRDQGMAAHGINIPVKEEYDELLELPTGGVPASNRIRCVEWNGEKYPTLEDALDVANIILHLADSNRGSRLNFADISRQPRRINNSPCWSGIIDHGRPYAQFTINTERFVPWRTLTGRQQMYLDHELYIDFGENVPTYKPKILSSQISDLKESSEDGLMLNFVTPHGKWQIHSTFYDTYQMRTLSRSMEPCWLHPSDAEKLNIQDNDWVELHNDHGVAVTRAAVSARVQPGTATIHHSAERTLSVPRSEIRNGTRAGVHNSLIRSRMKPLFLAGGYAQFSYFFNYWGPVGVNRDCYVRVRKLQKVIW